MKFAGLSHLGRTACTIAGWGQQPSYGRVPLARYGPCGYVSPSAKICHAELQLSKDCFIGDRVNIYQDRDGGAVSLSKDVHIHRDTTLHTGSGGAITIDANSHIQPRCQIVAYIGSIVIGRGCEIAPHCGFYAYDHGTTTGIPVRKQPMTSKGGIVLGDEVWLGFGVIVLDGITIGKDAIVGAGSVVIRDLPANCIAVGNPARVVKYRT